MRMHRRMINRITSERVCSLFTLRIRNIDDEIQGIGHGKYDGSKTGSRTVFAAGGGSSAFPGLKRPPSEPAGSPGSWHRPVRLLVVASEAITSYSSSNVMNGDDEPACTGQWLRPVR